MGLDDQETLGTERRRRDQSRIAVRVPTRIEPTDSAVAFQGHTENLSAGGISLRQEGILPRGTRVCLTLRLRRHVLLTLLGTVIWAQPLLDQSAYGLGIAFREPLPSALVADISTEPSSSDPS